jgi:hypothetical protein
MAIIAKDGRELREVAVLYGSEIFVKNGAEVQPDTLLLNIDP